jgi:hypothetical protein
MRQVAALASEWMQSPRTAADSLILFDALLSHASNDSSTYCNALWAVQNDNTHLGVDPERARRFLKACLPHGRANPPIFFNAWGVLVELGDLEGALDQVRAAVAHGFDRGRLRQALQAEKLFAGIKGDQRFIDALNGPGPKNKAKAFDPERLSGAGFSIPFGFQSWAAFVDDGHLWRVLTRLCILAEPFFTFGFTLRGGAGSPAELVFSIKGNSLPVTIDPRLLHKDALETLAPLLRQLNQALGQQGLDWRVFIADPMPEPEGGTNFGYRLLLTDTATAARVADSDWHAEMCIGESERIVKKTAMAEALPTLERVEEIVPPVRIFREDPGYPSLLAKYVERLAAFAELGPMTCVPTPSLSPRFWDAGFFTLRVIWSGKGGGSVQETIKITTVPRPDLNPIFECLNRAPQGRNKKRLRLYRCTARPWGEVAVLADVKQAERLRRLAYVIEPEKKLLKKLGKTGFVMPLASGHWVSWLKKGHGFGPHLERCLRRACSLARETFALSFDLAIADDFSVDLSYAAAEQRASFVYAADLEGKDILDVFPRVVRDLNGFLARSGIEFRFMILGEESGWEHRLILADRVWASVIAQLKHAVPHCLEPGFVPAQRPPFFQSYPPSAVDAGLPRLPDIDEIVPKKRICDSDFKSSSRSEDYPSVLQELASLARLKLDAEELAVSDESGTYYYVPAVYQGERAMIRMENEKYPDVTPMVDYLNVLLERGGRRERLYLFNAGGFSGGVALAKPQEAERLRQAGYVE